MSKGIWAGIILLSNAFCTVNSWGMDDLERFNGMQLAFVLIGPGGSVEEKTKPKPKPKAKPQTKQPAPAAPARPVAPKVVPVAPAKAVTPLPPTQPAPAPKAVPVAPVIKPEPAPATVVVPAPVRVKPVVAEPQRASRRKASDAAKAQWQFGVGVEIGGEELGTVTYSDGSTASVKANTGIALSFGGIIPNNDYGTFATQLSVGYKSGGPRLWSADVNWSAIPLEAIEFHREGNMRMGLGVSYQLNPQLKVSVPNATATTQFNNAVGFIAQLGWSPVRSHYSIDLRYTGISFQPSNGSKSVNGNVGGLYVNFLF